MKVLIDNTLLDRVGRLLKSSESDEIRPVDILALLHVVEHILFAEDIVVPSFEKMFSHSNTSSIIETFNKEGFSGDSKQRFLNLDVWTPESYIEACNKATWRTFDEVSAFNLNHIRKVSKFADDASNPVSSNICDFNDVASDLFSKTHSPEELIETIKENGTGTIQFMMLSNEPLRRSIQSIAKSDQKFTFEDSRSLTTIFRVQVYQELAESNYNAVYSPSPQRAKVCETNDLFFRYRLEKEIEQMVASHGQFKPPKLIKELQSLNSLPLPLFAIHALRGSNANSPYQMLETARKMRDDSEMISIRKWLSNWDSKLSSNNQKNRLSALNKINQLGEDIKRHLTLDTMGLIADLQPGLQFSVDPVSGIPTGKIDIGSSIASILSPIARRFEKNRRLIPILAQDLLTNDSIGRNILRMVNRPISIK